MTNEYRVVEETLFGTDFKFETGKLAKQASGAVLATCGGTTVLATVVATKDPIDEDFLPLTINYQEKSYAAGKIPGGYFKREGRPSEVEVLNSRLIDRPIRPLIPKEFNFSTQVMLTVMSSDQENDPGILSITAASAALMVSDVPFDGPIAGVKVGRVEGKFVINPTREQSEKSDMDISVVCTEEALIMVEGGSNEVNEESVVDALIFAHDESRKLIALQKRLVEGMDIAKREVKISEIDPEVNEAVTSFAKDRLRKEIIVDSKTARSALIKDVMNEMKESFGDRFEGKETDVSKAYEKLLKDLVRDIIANDRVRPDGRDYTTVRPITSEIGFLPRTHGSAVFTRGETQAAVVATLGTAYDEQRIDALEGDMTKSFMLHYNFPPYSVGETSFRLAPGRREIGHGALAERAIKPVLPSKENFPYTIRIVSEVLESNGSSSMATVCGSSLSLMNAGVPISAPVAGIAMGLIKEGDNFVVLSDILGDEDHLGDMDFKVAGTKNGITALQMDIKIKGITKEILNNALKQAYEGRMHILSKMDEVIKEPSKDLSQFAPRIISMQIDTNKIKDVIGQGGKTIKKIIEETGVQIDINDDGIVNIASPDGESCEKAKKMVEDLTTDLEVGKSYPGVVKRVLDFGAIVELKNGKDGLVHISELANERVKQVTDVLNEKDEVLVKCISIERDGKIRLSRKAALDENIADYK